MSSNDLTFKRKERKYIILEHTFDSIVEAIQDHIPMYQHEGKSGLVNIQTIYLDTKDFLLYNEFLNKRSFRFKVRLRRYGNDGVFEPFYLVELKVSHDSISTKKRFALPVEYYNDFLENKDLRSVVKEANQDLPGALKTYRLIYQLMSMIQLVPVQQTSYYRIAFQKKSKRVRITVDQRIEHRKLQGKPKTETLDAIVLESKIMGKTPKWHKKMVNQLSLLRQQRFSKYATGINSLYFPERGKYNFAMDEEDVVDEQIPQRIADSFAILKDLLKLDNSSLYGK